jgi:hypothetical protein
MDLLNQCNEKVTVERQDGSRHENVDALVTGKMILIPNARVPLAPGDSILRQLPSGLVERLVVTDPGFYAAVHDFPDHYQVKYRRQGQQRAEVPGYQIHLTGDNARVNISSTDNSVNTVNRFSYDLAALARELPMLRTALLERAKAPEQYAAIGAVATAELEAKTGDSSKVAKALGTLGSAGKWVFDTAKEIGVQVAAEIIKAHIQP